MRNSRDFFLNRVLRFLDHVLLHGELICGAYAPFDTSRLVAFVNLGQRGGHPLCEGSSGTASFGAAP